MVELPRVFPPPRSPGLGCLRRVAAWAGEFGRTDPEASYRRFVAAGLTTRPAPPWAEARHGWLLGSERFLDRLRQRLGDQAHRDLRRERRLLRGLGLARVIEAVCSRYGVDRGQLAARGSRSQALAYLAKHHTESTCAELVPILGLSRPEGVPNLSARFAALLQTQSNARRDLVALELALGLSGENSKSGGPQESVRGRGSRIGICTPVLGELWQSKNAPTDSAEEATLGGAQK